MSADFGNCSSTATRNITVSALPAVDFYSANSNSFCKGPAAIVFQNLTADVASASWNFGDGGTSNSAAPSVTHTYGAAASGNFTVTLAVTDSKGCSSTITKPGYVNILAPFVTIGGIPGGLCKGQTFTPSFTGGTVDGVGSYDWDFGDGSPHSNLSVPAHSYAANGNYTVKLTIVTTSGCTASGTSSNPIQVSDAPVVNFDKDKDPVCHSDVVTFTNLSTPVNAPPNAVVWSFGDGTTSTLSNPPPHKFPDTGAYTIQLKVTNFGCSDSLTKVGLVHVLPPVANFGYKVMDCNLKTNVTFIDSSKNGDIATYGALSYIWNFGDGSPTDLTPAPVHTYPAITSYSVQLIINNTLCHDTITKIVELISDKAAFVLDKPVYCRNEKITYSSTNNTSHIKVFNWVVDGVPHVTDQAGYYDGYPVTGSHTVQLITTDINGCSDTSAPQTYSVTGPTVAFGLATNGGCKGSTLTFIDSSTSVGTIKSWTFDFGDGIIKSSVAPFTHQYADTGLYQVKLTVQDDIGCQDSMVKPVLVTKPLPKFSAAQTTFCPGVPLQFTDSSAGKGLSYNWNFGDGQTDSVKNPLHQYSVLRDSVYSVTLIVKDTSGCSDTLVQSNYIKVRSPKALYSVTDTVTFCPPLETKFFFTGKDYESFSWDFGDGGGPSSLANINHFYNKYGSYQAKLYAVGFGGCIDSATINIAVTDPYATTSVTFDPKTACNNLTVIFTVKAPDSSKYYLNFGDGGVDSLKTTFSHYYNLPNVYSPYILIADNVGCQVIIGGLGNVDIKGAVPLFGIDKKAFCDQGTVNFTDYSQDGNDPIVTRTWDFGDGSTPQVLPGGATYTYTKPGLFVPTLSVTTVANCTQTFTDTIRVLATPQPIITSADGVCVNLPLAFSGSLLVPPDTAINWKWDTGNGQTSTQQNISVTYSDAGLHHLTLEATNSLGCKGDTSRDIKVFPLPSIQLAGDTSIIAGGAGITIPLTYSPNATSYNWTPATSLSCTDCSNPFATPKFTTTYQVIVTDSNGCISSRNVTLVVICNDKNFFIPNTFSPNNDGSNDRFYPRGTGLNLIQAMRIFNRWGELIFEKRNFPANDASSGWDGTYKGKPAPTDTYIYMIDIICNNASIITSKGNVTLIR
ncbi:MAG: PKD domain-containing protein, partial [Bacteroidota bacterium]